MFDAIGNMLRFFLVPLFVAILLNTSMLSFPCRCRDSLIVKLATLACLAAPKRVLLGTTGRKAAESNIILVPIDLEATILQSVPIAGHDSEGMARVSGDTRVRHEAEALIAMFWPRPAP